jgi:hypothetical protein
VDPIPDALLLRVDFSSGSYVAILNVVVGTTVPYLVPPPPPKKERKKEKLETRHMAVEHTCISASFLK